MTRTPTSQPDIPPESLGGYRIVQTLTAARSYSGVAENGREVVIKVMDDACLVDGDLHPDIRQRLGRVRELAVPGVANLLSVERDANRVFMVWDRVHGTSLADWLAIRPDRNQRLLAARELVLIVESMHAAGIVHGAIHERNVFRDALGRLWVTHISPLLVADPQDDVEPLNKLLRTVLSDTQFAPADSLGQMRLSLAAMIDARDANSIDDRRVDRETRRRGLMLLLAVGVAVLAALVSYIIWTQTRTAETPNSNESVRIALSMPSSVTALTFSPQRLPLPS